MTLQLVSAYSGIDSLGNEVDLKQSDYPFITNKLDAYCKEHWKTLRAYMDEVVVAVEAEIDELETSEVLDKQACLIVYFYFSDWLETYDLEPDMTGETYPCFAVTPQEIGLDYDVVMAVLNSLPPITANWVD